MWGGHLSGNIDLGRRLDTSPSVRLLLPSIYKGHDVSWKNKTMNLSTVIAMYQMCLGSGYDIDTEGKADTLLSRVSDSMHWALATIDDSIAGNNLHYRERNLTAGSLLEVHSYKICQYNPQTL